MEDSEREKNCPLKVCVIGDDPKNKSSANSHFILAWQSIKINFCDFFFMLNIIRHFHAFDVEAIIYCIMTALINYFNPKKKKLINFHNSCNTADNRQQKSIKAFSNWIFSEISITWLLPKWVLTFAKPHNYHASW